MSLKLMKSMFLGSTDQLPIDNFLDLCGNMEETLRGFHCHHVSTMQLEISFQKKMVFIQDFLRRRMAMKRNMNPLDLSPEHCETESTV